MEAQYAFRVRVRLGTRRSDVGLEPSTVETRLTLAAPDPGEEGWLFFRNHLWRGELSDPAHARRLADEWLEPPVESIDFRALYVDEAYFDALKAAIADDLGLFKADDVSEVLSKYLGSSIEVRDTGTL